MTWPAAILVGWLLGSAGFVAITFVMHLADRYWENKEPRRGDGRPGREQRR